MFPAFKGLGKNTRNALTRKILSYVPSCYRPIVRETFHHEVAPEYIACEQVNRLIRENPDNIVLLRYCVESYHWSLNDFATLGLSYERTSTEVLRYVIENDFSSDEFIILQYIARYNRKDVFDIDQWDKQRALEAAVYEDCDWMLHLCRDLPTFESMLWNSLSNTYRLAYHVLRYALRKAMITPKTSIEDILRKAYNVPDPNTERMLNYILVANRMIRHMTLLGRAECDALWSKIANDEKNKSVYRAIITSDSCLCLHDERHAQED